MKNLALFLTALFPLLASAQTGVEKVNALITEGKEVAWVIDDATNADDENLTVLFTARAKGVQPTGFPIIIGDDVAAVETDAINEDVCTMENAVVLLVEKKIVGRVKLPNPEEAQVYFPGRNHGSLGLLWGPEQDGWNFGLLIYGSKWYSPEIMLIETGDGFLQTSIKSTLDASTMKFIGSGAKDIKGVNAKDYAISYQPVSVLKPEAKYQVGDPVTVKLAFTAEVPKSDVAPFIEGALTVRLETSDEKLSAKVLKVEPAAQ